MMRATTRIAIIVCSLAFAFEAQAGLGCIADNLRALIGRGARGENGVPPASPTTVGANQALYPALQSNMRTQVEAAAARGKLKIIRVTRNERGDITGYELLPPEIVPGRYYSAIRLPDGSVAIGEFDYRNGIHTAMSKAFGGRPRELGFKDGLPCGGIIFYDTGAQVGGFCRNYPGPKNLRDISGALRRMGIRVERSSTPGRIVETNPRPRREDIDMAPMRF